MSDRQAVVCTRAVGGSGAQGEARDEIQTRCESKARSSNQQRQRRNGCCVSLQCSERRLASYTSGIVYYHVLGLAPVARLIPSVGNFFFSCLHALLFSSILTPILTTRSSNPNKIIARHGQRQETSQEVQWRQKGKGNHEHLNQCYGRSRFGSKFPQASWPRGCCEQIERFCAVAEGWRCPEGRCARAHGCGQRERLEQRFKQQFKQRL
jgi:hypothetical protein